MDLVDSSVEELPPQQIVIQSMGQAETDIPLAKLLITFTREAALETADVQHFGNTIFLAQRGGGKNKNKMVGRAFNMDTGRNFINNALAYMDYLQGIGITHYSTTFRGEEFLTAFKIFGRFIKGGDSAIRIGQDENNVYIALVRLGKQPIPKGF
tara:strand:- start:49 stop:510 length:462 start_codon:yes stop_codon:yes gene_type:complete